MSEETTSDRLRNNPASASPSPPPRPIINDHRRQDARHGGGHAVILRASATAVAGIIAVLLITAVAPPIVADQSDRAVVDAPVTLLTAPIGGDIDRLTAAPGSEVRAGDTLAQISNPRLDRGTLISLEEKSSDAREQLQATRAKIASDRSYVAALDQEIAAQTEQIKGQFQSQINELRARVDQSKAISGEKKALVDRQTSMVARDAASIEMVRPTSQQYSAALHNADAETAKLDQKIAQLGALNRGVYVGDDLIAISNLAQKRRDIDLDAKRLTIDEVELSGVLSERQQLIDAERKRLDSLATAQVQSPEPGRLLTVGAAMGRHVSAGDTIASVVDCDKLFVVAIFSYRQGQTMNVGTRVRIDGGGVFASGLVTAVLPKTSDKLDERFAVPFPQTERRELYAIVKPDREAGHIGKSPAGGLDDSAPACAIGRWVTVTRDNGMVPSMSVAWRRLQNLVGALVGGDDADRNVDAPLPVPRAADRRVGMAQPRSAELAPLPQPASRPGEAPATPQALVWR